MKKTHWMFLSALVALALLLTSCGTASTADTPTAEATPVTVSGVIAEGNLTPADSANLSFSLSGIVKDILADEGDRVEEGAAIARLRDVEAPEAQILVAQTAVLQAQQALDDLNERADLVHTQALDDLVQAQQALVEAERAWDEVDTEDFQTDLDDARIAMNDAEDDLQDAQDDLKDYEYLDEDNATRQSYEDAVENAQQAYDEARWEYEDLQYRYDQAEAQLAAARAAVEDAQKTVDATANGPDPDDLALAQANLDQANRQLDAAEADLAYVELIAPFAGKIVWMELTEGAPTSPGDLAAVIIDDSQWYVETNDLTEDEVVKIATGQLVTVTFDALPGQAFDGEVESISEYSQERYGDVTYVARIRLLDSDELLRWGMTAEVTFEE
jgi:multidrug efflux pump subunit AcrA (membrane-fusion protein)